MVDKYFLQESQRLVSPEQTVLLTTKADSVMAHLIWQNYQIETPAPRVTVIWMQTGMTPNLVGAYDVDHIT